MLSLPGPGREAGADHQSCVRGLVARATAGGSAAQRKRTSRPIRRRSHSFATCAAGLHAPGSVTATTAAAMPPTVSTTE
jgi:hypothetical protein